MKTCAACGKQTNRVTALGGTLLCVEHYHDLSAKAQELHAEGKTVDVGKLAREMFREQYSAGSYLLKDIPANLWNTAKHRGIDTGETLREMLLNSLREYLAK